MSGDSEGSTLSAAYTSGILKDQNNVVAFSQETLNVPLVKKLIDTARFHIFGEDFALQSRTPTVFPRLTSEHLNVLDISDKEMPPARSPMNIFNFKSLVKKHPIFQAI